MGKARRTAPKGYDNYPTPAWATDIILPHLNTPNTILEPAVGEAALFGRLVKRWPDASCFTMDIRDVDAPCDNHATRDFLTVPDGMLQVDLLITNPPYCIIGEFAQKAVTMVKPGGQVALLVPSGFVGPKCRVEFHKAHPAALHWLPRRPSFTGDGRNAGTEYIWWVYTRGSNVRSWSIL